MILNFFQIDALFLVRVVWRLSYQDLFWWFYFCILRFRILFQVQVRRLALTQFFFFDFLGWFNFFSHLYLLPTLVYLLLILIININIPFLFFSSDESKSSKLSITSSFWSYLSFFISFICFASFFTSSGS